jgi:amino acid transporter
LPISDPSHPSIYQLVLLSTPDNRDKCRFPFHHIHILQEKCQLILQPAGDAFNFILDVEGYPASIINLFVVLGLFILRYTSPKAHRPFKTWIIVPVFFLIAQGFLLTAPFLRPPGGKGDTSLPYWLYPIVGITVLILGGSYWLVWRVLWPKLGGFQWVESKASLQDGTVVTEFEKRKVA